MCGIAGAVSGYNQELQVARMIEAQRHRGPDDQGIWNDGFCTLGHRRLSIIDLSESGRQPLSNEDGTIWITFNGEIYNFQSLRRELESLGHGFSTRTDTEVIVHAYEQWDVKCLDRLRGMFAFGIWDQRKKRLLLARDRVGKKPLYYTELNDSFLFASELQGLLADSRVKREINIQAIDEYLAYGYIPAPRTGFRNIFKLPPAHWMTIDYKLPKPVKRIESYWSLNYLPKLPLSEDEACQALREKLTEAVSLRMISDAPLGAFLSGGIDSSIVVGLMAGLSSQPVKTFSIGFAEAAFNELPHARRIADKWGTNHHEYIVEASAMDVLPKLVRYYGEPFADSSALPTYYVSQLTSREVTVALNGDGGDESFAGYDRYWANSIAERLGQIPGLAFASRNFSKWLPDNLGHKSRVNRVKRFLSAAAQPMAQRYCQWVGGSSGCFNSEARCELYSAGMRQQLESEDAANLIELLFARAGSGNSRLDPVDAAMSVDIGSYLPFDLLVKVDIASMANSLEARSPLLDHQVMEFAARLPIDLKLRGRQSKYLLKRAFSDLLPAENVNRPKMGFGVPVGDWFRTSMRELLEDSLLSKRSLDRGYFQTSSLRRMISEHQNRQADHGANLWNLLMLELWHREVVESEPALPDSIGADSRQSVAGQFA